MRLDFNVLWVDDQPDRVRAQIDAIARHMAAEGFQFNPKLCRSVHEVQAAISENVFTDEVDLILVDWVFGGGVTGQDVIAEIRTAIRYKDVVFYSGLTAPDELRRAAFEKGLEGVYCANRTVLVDEVKGVFESLVKKVLDLDHTRGIVMGATSDIDHIVNECLASVHDKLDDAGKAAMVREAMGHIERRLQDLSKAVAKLQGASTIQELFEAHMILTANDRLRMLAGVLDGRGKDYKDYRKSVVAYQQKVVPGRNMLGHLVLVPEGKPREATDSHGKPISLEQTRDLRILILGLRSDFRSLLAVLRAE